MHLPLPAACFLPLTFAAPAAEKRDAPTIQLSYATVIGSSALGVDSFKGIPYAQPPVGQLRLKLPQPINSNLGVIKAVGIPRSCPQFLLQTNTGSLPQDTLAKLLNTPFGQTVTDSGED